MVETDQEGQDDEELLITTTPALLETYAQHFDVLFFKCSIKRNALIEGISGSHPDGGDGNG